MLETDYLDTISDGLERLKKLQAQSVAIDAEIAKIVRLIAATADLLPDQKRNLVMALVATTQELHQLRQLGLSDAARAILKNSADQWLTVSDVRDHLVSAGYDFSNYRASPLASISTTLIRLGREGEVETHRVDDSATVYRWRAKLPPLDSLYSDRPKSKAARNAAETWRILVKKK